MGNSVVGEEAQRGQQLRRETANRISMAEHAVIQYIIRCMQPNHLDSLGMEGSRVLAPSGRWGGPTAVWPSPASIRLPPLTELSWRQLIIEVRSARL